MARPRRTSFGRVTLKKPELSVLASASCVPCVLRLNRSASSDFGEGEIRSDTTTRASATGNCFLASASRRTIAPFKMSGLVRNTPDTITRRTAAAVTTTITRILIFRLSGILPYDKGGTRIRSKFLWNFQRLEDYEWMKAECSRGNRA